MTVTDIGREPALTFDAEDTSDSAIDRRGINFRWLASTVLTGLAGGALMGGALFIAFDRQSQFAEAPSIAHAGLRSETTDGGAIGAGKSDRVVVRRDEDVSSRRLIQETSVRHVDGKEFVKVTPYVRVTSTLPLVRTEFSKKAPPFNPLKIFSEVGDWNDDRSRPNLEQDDSVAIAYSPFNAAIASNTQADVLDIAEIEQTIRENVDFVATNVAFAVPAILPVSATGYAALNPTAAFNPINAAAQLAPQNVERFSVAAPANITTVFKRYAEAEVEDTEEVNVEIQKGDTLVSILTDHGATKQEAAELIDLVRADGEVPVLQIDDIVRLSLAAAGDIEDPDRARPVGLTLPAASGEKPRTVALPLPRLASAMPLNAGNLKAGNLGAGNLTTGSLRRSTTPSPISNGPRANVYDGLFDAGYRHNVPAPLVDELVRVFSFDVDFQRSVTPGDMLEVFYAETGEEAGEEDPELLFASISTRSDTKRFYRFRTPDDGVVDFYDATGKSAKKFLMRKPMSSGTFRSGYGMRRHPILGYTRMHSGVDWAARTGTPIMASGNGTIEKAAWKSGYGRHILIRHANGYETSYSHMSGFARGIKSGVRVRQGQIIGYVGSTGLSTGPHLHYEVMVNNRNVDPMRIRLPRGRVLDGRLLAGFEKEKMRIDSLMNRAPASTRVASR